MEENRQNSYSNPLKATWTGIRDLFHKQVPAGELLPGDNLDGKVVLVDGSSSGLGLAVATDCARRGAQVIMACRSGIPEKGERVRKKSGSEKVSMLPVDFSDVPSILTLVKTLSEQNKKIDILICNAGIVPKQSRKTKQGLEEMFMVNYLSKFIFINKMIENGCLTSAPGTTSRIIIVSSESHRNPKAFDWSSFGIYHPYGISKSIELYGYYKLLLTTFAVELSRRINRDNQPGYSVFALCPGPINSNIGREAPKIFQPLMKLVFSIFFRSPEKAAIPVMYLAASKDIEGKPFDYLFLMSRKEVDEKALNELNGRELWNRSEILMNSLLKSK